MPSLRIPRCKVAHDGWDASRLIGGLLRNELQYKKVHYEMNFVGHVIKYSLNPKSQIALYSF